MLPETLEKLPKIVLPQIMLFILEASKAIGVVIILDGAYLPLFVTMVGTSATFCQLAGNQLLPRQPDVLLISRRSILSD